MYQRCRKVSALAVSALAVSALAVAVIAASAVAAHALDRPAAASRAAFSGNLCGLLKVPELAAAHISAPCVKGRTTRTSANTPLGSVTTQTFGAHWGSLPHGGPSGPSHYLTMIAARYTGSAPALAFGLKRIRNGILRHGKLVSVGNPGTLDSETFSCVNPPKEDCTHLSVFGLVKDYVLEVTLYDFPPTGVGVVDPGEDEPQDNAQQELDEAPIVSIAKTVAAKL